LPKLKGSNFVFVCDGFGREIVQREMKDLKFEVEKGFGDGISGDLLPCFWGKSQKVSENIREEIAWKFVLEIEMKVSKHNLQNATLTYKPT
jgi:hypothetical protein